MYVMNECSTYRICTKYIIVLRMRMSNIEQVRSLYVVFRSKRDQFKLFSKFSEYMSKHDGKHEKVRNCNIYFLLLDRSRSV